MLIVHVRLYEELNQVLPASERKRTVTRTLPLGSRLSRLLDALELSWEAIDLALVRVYNLDRCFCLRSRLAEEQLQEVVYRLQLE
ncbi:MAG: hypothetical protein R6U55_06190 [Desulfovermiculus sp.]